MSDIIFSDHARKQMGERGASKQEVIQAISEGESSDVKNKRVSYRKNFQYNKKWEKNIIILNR